MGEESESEAVTDWLLSVGPNTRRGYMYYLRRFCEFVGLTPDQLIREGIKDRRAVHRKLKAERRGTWYLSLWNEESYSMQIGVKVTTASA